MKKIFSLITLLLIVVFSLTACFPFSFTMKREASSQSPEAEPSNTAKPIIIEQPSKTAEDGKTPSEEQIFEMLPIMDSIIRCTTENDYVYDKDNDDFVWSVLYYVCVNYYENFPEIEMNMQQGYITVPADTAKALASACFYELEELPEIQEDRTNISYDRGNDAYIVMMSDASMMYTKIKSSDAFKDGSAEVYVDFIDGETDELISTYIFEFKENKSEFTERFPLSVAQVVQNN